MNQKDQANHMTIGKEDMDQVLLEKQVFDWRIHDEADDDLTDLQKQPWTIRVQNGAYGGLHIEAVAPDGTVRKVSLEISKGNLHAIVGGVDDDNHATVQIGEKGTVVEAMTPAIGARLKAVRFDADGAAAVDGVIEPGCTVAQPTP